MAGKQSKVTENKPAGKKLPAKYLLLGAGIVVLLVLAYFSKSLFIAAVVNGQPIPRSAVISELEKQGGKQTLSALITRALIIQEAKKRNITVSQKDIDAQLKTIENNVSRQGVTLDEALKQQGMTKNDLVDQIRLQLILQKIVGGNITVTDKEVEDYVSASKDVSKEQAKEQLKQQKEQQKIQDYLTQLKEKARVTYFVQY